MGYAFWTPLGRIGPELEIVRAAALVVVAMGSAVLYPYVREMFDAIIFANKDHEKFLVAAESSLDAFYILESVRDDAKKIVDFRFSYVNTNGEQRFGKLRTELVGEHLSEMLPYMVSTGLLERYKQVVQTGLPFTDEHQVDRDAGSEAGRRSSGDHPRRNRGTRCPAPDRES
jgi:PAS domain-containing protein